MLEQQFVAISLGNIIELDDLVAELRSVRDLAFEIGLLLPAVLAGELLIRAESRLGLRMTRLRSHSDPFQLPFQCLFAFALLLLLHLQALGLLLQP